MPNEKHADSKAKALREQGVFNLHPEMVAAELFQDSDFFDPMDLLQVKYEMLRRVRVEKQPVSGTAAGFGFSRPTFYEAQRGFEREGLAGLIAKKRGPRGAHKLTEGVVNFIEAAAVGDSALRAPEFARQVQEHFGITVHSRSIERALARRKKKRRRIAE